MTKRGRLTRVLAVAAVAGLALGAGRMPKLPKDQDLPRGADSPGAVTFSHEMHVDSARPDCTGCHPRLFPITGEKKGVGQITHATMEKKQYCGACHDGQQAKGFDDCTVCHRSE